MNLSHSFYPLSFVFTLFAASMVSAGPLHEAAFLGNVEQAKKLIAQGHSVNEPKGADAWMPLHFAVMMRKTAMVSLLVSRGANVKAKTIEGDTPLHMAVARGKEMKIADLLIKNGADTEARNNNGATPLHLAAGVGNIAGVEFLIQQGADINAKARNGLTPLGMAKRNKVEAVIIVLKRYKAKN